jgi:hypothetical protein
VHERSAADPDPRAARRQHNSGRGDQAVFDRPTRLRDERQDQVAESESEREAEYEGDDPGSQSKRDRLLPRVVRGGNEQLAADERRIDGIGQRDRDDGNRELQRGGPRSI